MNEQQSWTDHFEGHRPRLAQVARRILGEHAGADDAVQECWLRLQRTDPDSIDNLAGWATTTTARICLDSLRRRARVELTDTVDGAGAASDSSAEDPAVRAALAESVGEALAVVLETLNPAERVAFVLHDTFGVAFDDIGAVLERSPAAAKQLATRARTKIRGSDDVADPPATVALADRTAHADVVRAFLRAARGGNLAALVGVLHPDIALRADQAAIAMGAPDFVLGADNVAAVFSGRAQMAIAAWIDDVAGMVWQVGGGTKVAWEFTIADGRVARIDMVADTDTLASVDVSAIPPDPNHLEPDAAPASDRGAPR